MYNSFEMEKFKSINSLKIENLSRINLFFGRNNCGKTTLLEAIFLISGISNPELFRRCNSFRSFNQITDLSYFFHNLDISMPVKFLSTGNVDIYNRTAQLDFEKLEKKVLQNNTSAFEVINNLSETSILKITGSVNNQSVVSSITLQFLKNGEKNEIRIPKNYHERINCNYLAPRVAFETIPNMVRKILEDKQEKFVVEALQLFDSNIKDFVLTNNDVMVDVVFEKRIPINLLGDGIRKFFTLILSIYCSKDGVLIIDEIDNGLHYSSMKTLWNIIFKVSEQFNTQLFITTHNIDSLKGLKKLIDDKQDYKTAVSFFKIMHKPTDENIALYYNTDNFSAVIEQENEIR